MVLPGLTKKKHTQSQIRFGARLKFVFASGRTQKQAIRTEAGILQVKATPHNKGLDTVQCVFEHSVDKVIQ